MKGHLSSLRAVGFSLISALVVACGGSSTAEAPRDSTAGGENNPSRPAAPGPSSTGSDPGIAHTPPGKDGQIVDYNDLSPLGEAQVVRADLYQVVERTLYSASAPIDSKVPILANRKTLLRFSVASFQGYDGPVVGKFTLKGQAPRYAKITKPYGEEFPSSESATLNFELTEAEMGEGFDYELELLRPGQAGQATSANLLSAVTSTSVKADLKDNRLKVVLVPIAYGADGSNRLPDTSPAQLKAYRDRLFDLYPTTGVDVSVRAEPLQWQQSISPSGGWTNLLYEIMNLRNSDGVANDVYYYGIFNPKSTLGEHCAKGCTLGLTFLNDSHQKAPAGSVGLRMAIGVGYGGVAEGTAAHEIGHSHGREHAPCGFGLAAGSVDLNYPIKGGRIGRPAYDFRRQELLGVGLASDFMGYCSDEWISAYNFKALRDRMVAIKSELGGPTDTPMPQSGQDMDAFAVSENGEGRYLNHSVLRGISGHERTVNYIDASGQPRSVVGQWLKVDHQQGGLLLVPHAAHVQGNVRFQVSGKSIKLSGLAKSLLTPTKRPTERQACPGLDALVSTRWPVSNS